MNGRRFDFNRLHIGKKQIVLLVMDVILVNLAVFLSLGIEFGFEIQNEYMELYRENMFTYTAVVIFVFYMCNSYRSLWGYAGVEEILHIVFASITSMVALNIIFSLIGVDLLGSMYVVNALGLMLTVGGARFLYRILFKPGGIHISPFRMDFSPDIRMLIKSRSWAHSCDRVMIAGAGEAGFLVIKELYENPSVGKIPVCVVDDNKNKIGRKIHGIPIMGSRDDITRLAKEHEIDEIIIAMPSAPLSVQGEIIEICKKTMCSLKILPGVYQIIEGRVDISMIKDVQIEDLLGRDQVEVDMENIAGYLSGKTVFVTGGGGSIGSELCRQAAGFGPKKLIVLDIYENNAYELEQEIKRRYKGGVDIDVVIASVRDKGRVSQVFETYRPDVVFHAAAHKHVPLMENSPMEAVKNNVMGTLNVAEMASRFGVSKFILISSDKAVNPTNIMGATKRICELIVQSMDKVSSTEFGAVRFGNVLGSSGSVVPLFKRQIAEGGPVTVTHPEIIRYFMTIQEAVQLIIQAGAMARGGEIFVLDMGEPVRIADLASDLIRLSGFEPGEDISIEYTGLRPGEKLYEELLMAEEGLRETFHDKIFIAKPFDIDIEYVKCEIESLEKITRGNDLERLREGIKRLVPSYTHED
ncbi:nucleoside-diphosphate sugar epimerase/dehydratase [Peptoclostridium litorale]|uniref:polysaccharide biosynthesis protein n=1 Tax=Peptoclostridium litorale TaxID=1557 RepID=UPI002E8E4B5D|nr:nucleoside-diphosphate sugar epimerase/dehydratase [Peptoclostridium litorale]